MIHRPIGENGFAVDELARDGAEDARIIRAVAVVAHDEKTVRGKRERRVARAIEIICRDVRLHQLLAIHIETPGANFDRVSRQAHHPLDEGFRAVERIPEDDYIAALDRLKSVHELIDENALLIAQERRHAGAFDFYRLIKKDDDDEREAEGDG